MGQRHRGHALADQRIVRVVPLGPLGVHPQPAARQQAAGLGQHDGRELLAQRGQHRLPVGVADEAAIAAEHRRAGQRPRVGVRVENQRGLRPCGLLGVRPQPVGHVGEAVQRAVPPAVQQRRVARPRRLHQAQQVDDLVVAPVADLAPGVVGLDHLPVDAGPADAVGVVAVGRHRAEEGGDHRAGVVRRAGEQGLPVLEDVAPVPLVVQHAAPRRIAHLDRETVPGPAGIAMAAAEGQRQVGQQQALALRPGGRARRVARRHPRPRCRRPRGGRAGRQLRGPVGEDPAAHDVEQHVGPVVRSGHRVGGDLQAVGAGQQVVQAGGVGGHRGADLGLGAAAVLEPIQQLGHLHLRARGIDDLVPGQARRLDAGLELHQEGAAAAAREVLGLHRRAAAEGGHLCIGQQRAAARGHAGVPGHQGLEALLGLGAVPDAGVQRVQAEPPAGRRLVPLVGVGQAAHRGGVRNAQAGGHQVQQPVEHLHAHQARVGAQPHAAHQAERRGARPLLLDVQAARGVRLAQPQPGAGQVLPDRARTAAADHVAGREGLPQGCRRVVGQADPGARPGVLPASVDAVDRLVGEERAFGVAPSRGQRAGGGDEGPDIAVAGQRDEEGRRVLAAVDAVPGLPVVLHEATAQAAHAGSSRGRGRGGARAQRVQRTASMNRRSRSPAFAGLPVKA
ncbi:hypothetical protein ABXN37_19240 [Piscinibacter sakaiensis]|uniref:hypothetical protein n=1 Tax=Piscinibacter sakaiensis TaxID=1547922 RepID=UPI00372AE2E8